MSDLWGQDISLSAAGQALLAANGELILTDGVSTGVQDIILRLLTPLGSLFYDTGFGSLIHEWIYEESTEENRAGFVAEVLMRIEADPRVVPYSVRVSILKWDDRQLVARARWNFISEDQPFNLVMQADKETKDLLIADINAAASSFSADIKDY